MAVRIKRWLMVISVSVMVFSVSGAYAAEEGPKGQVAPPADFRKAFEQAQREALERLKQENPQVYQQQKASLDRQNKIQETIGLYSQGKLSLAEAKAALSPLVKQQMQEEGALGNLDARIQHLEERLSFFKKAKLQPELLVQERIDQMLGQGGAFPLLQE